MKDCGKGRIIALCPVSLYLGRRMYICLAFTTEKGIFAMRGTTSMMGKVTIAIGAITFMMGKATSAAGVIISMTEEETIAVGATHFMTERVICAFRNDIG